MKGRTPAMLPDMLPTRHLCGVFLAIPLWVCGCGAEVDPGDADAATWGQVQAPAPAEEPPTFVEDIQPIFEEWCNPCHLGDTPRGCMGTLCLSSFHEVHFLWTCCEATGIHEEPPPGCRNEPITVGACGLNRIHSFLEMGKDPMPPDQVELVEEWFAAGMPEQ